MIAVKAAPGSFALGRNSPKMRKCALDEIGKNSVNPCNSPRKSASSKLTKFLVISDALAFLAFRIRLRIQ